MPENSPSKPVSPSGESLATLVLTADHRMLLEIRDTLYEGSWDDFARDLESRRRGEPHVFVTVPESQRMLATIGNHLALIGEMQTWERDHQTTLRADDEAA